MDIEQGLEIKIVYDRGINAYQIVRLTASNTHHLTISLGDDTCTFQGCPIGTLNLNTAQQYGETFILKIYRKDDQLRVDLDGNKNVEIDMDTLNQGYWACSHLWGEDENYKFQFTAVSSDLQAQFRVEEADEDEDEEEEEEEDRGKLIILLALQVGTRDKLWNS